ENVMTASATIGARRVTAAVMAVFAAGLLTLQGCGDGRSSSTVCGNGRVEDGEECDDSNVQPVDGCSPECRQEPAVVALDLSEDLVAFSVGRLAGLGFCPVRDSVFNAAIQRVAGDAGYRLDASVLDVAPVGDPNCIEDLLGDSTCLRETRLPGRALSADE